MSANGTRTIIWANGEDQFCLAKIGLLLDLEAKCNAPVGVIFGRLGSGNFGINDIRETIRLGLIGGGMSPDRAMTAVKSHVDGNPLASSVLTAYCVLEAVMVGVPDDPVGKGMAEKAGEADSSTPMADSADPK